MHPVNGWRIITFIFKADLTDNDVGDDQEMKARPIYSVMIMGSGQG